MKMKLLACLALMLVSNGVRADAQVIPLWSADRLNPKPQDHEVTTPDKTIGRRVKDVSEPTITVYPAPADRNTGCAVIVCPGGGYAGLALDYEGTDVAKWFNTFGVSGVVLKYRMPKPNVTKDGIPLPLRDSRRAIQIIRSRAEEWKIDPNRIGIMGFSAGGHLAATTGTHIMKPDPNATDPLDRVSSRPDFMVLVYPVITMDPAFTHGGSRKNLLGDHPSVEMTDLYSNEKQVTRETPPAFLLHAVDDPAVPVANSQRFFDALHAAHVSCEFIQVATGGHGFGLGNPPRGSTDTRGWPDQLAAWMKGQGLVAK